MFCGNYVKLINKKLGCFKINWIKISLETYFIPVTAFTNGGNDVKKKLFDTRSIVTLVT